MEKLYQKIYIEDFDLIKQELLDLIKPDRIESGYKTMTSWIPKTDQVLNYCPVLNKFLKARCKKEPNQIKFYLSPPGVGIGTHIDGLNKEYAQPFGLALPLKNTERTYFNWYESDHISVTDCPITDDFNSRFARALWAPKESLKLIDKLEIIEPTFTRSDILHDVTNRPDTMRYMVIVRWPPHYKKIEDVIDIMDILI